MLYDVKDVLVGANRKVRIPEVMELVVKIGLRNKKKIKVDDGKDILDKKRYTNKRGQRLENKYSRLKRHQQEQKQEKKVDKIQRTRGMLSRVGYNDENKKE